MDYLHKLDDLLGEIYPEPELPIVEETVIEEEIFEEVIREEPKVFNKLELALQKRREIKESTNRSYERPQLQLGKEVINYKEVVEALGLASPKKKINKPRPNVVIEEVEEPEMIVEDVITNIHQPDPASSFVDLMAQSLGDYVNRSGPNVVKKELDIYEQRFDVLERHLTDMRRLILESASSSHNSMFSPGGGETRALYMDDVASQTINVGDVLTWDGTQFVGTGGTGTQADITNLQKQIDDLEESTELGFQDVYSKMDSMQNQIDYLLNSEGGFVKLEDNTVADGEPTPTGVMVQNWNVVPEGDVTRFRVSLDPNRNVYALEGIPQPTVEVPRGDVIELDINSLDHPETFGIFKNGVELEVGVERDDSIGLITIRTGRIPEEITKIYYKDRVKKGIGWVIQIIDN